MSVDILKTIPMVLVVTVLIGAASAPKLQAQELTILDVFNEMNGAIPSFESLAQGVDGNLYGTTEGGGPTSYGTVFKITPTGTLTTLYNFCSEVDCTDGAVPSGGLDLATNGSFYGSTSGGGLNGRGTVYKISVNGGFAAGSFGPNDGYWPGAVVEGTDGDFYGFTNEGGTDGRGTIFRASPSGTLTTIYNLTRNSGSGGGANTLLLAYGGDFYGSAYQGGINPRCACGTVFKISPSGNLIVLHSFGGTDGAFPFQGLFLATDGNFYGTTGFGGDSPACPMGCGTVFRMSPSGKLTTVHSFDSTDGQAPLSGLIQATDGNLYGTTRGSNQFPCAPPSCGTVFQISRSGAFTTLYEFDGSAAGAPSSTLFQATNGALYGTTDEGGDLQCGAPQGCGTVFSLDMGLGPFVSFIRPFGRVGQTGGILGQGFTGASSVTLNGAPATFAVISDTYIRATIPSGATTGYVTVTTPSGTLTSNVRFHVIP